MTALNQDRATQRREGLVIDALLAAAAKIFGGSLACVNAAGYAIPGANAAGNIFLGVSEDRYDNTGGAAGAISGTFRRKGLFRFASISNLSIANMGDNAFVYDDQTVGLLADCNQAVFCGTIVKVEGQNDCWVDVEPATRLVDHTAALAQLATGMTTASGLLPIPLPVITSAGVALAAFQSEDAASGGYCVTAKGLGIRWNNHATPGPAVASKIVVPPDADITAKMVLHLLVAKTGATVGDATVFNVGAYNNVVGAAYDADADFGGETGAMVGNATAKNVQHLTRDLALADLADYPAAIELTLKPKNGTLGTDDVILLAAWITYTKKILEA